MPAFCKKGVLRNFAKFIRNHKIVGARGQTGYVSPQSLSVTLMFPFVILTKVDHERFFWKKRFWNFIFPLVILSVLSHLRCCKGLKWQSRWGFIPNPTLWVYKALYSLTQFSFREKYKYPSWTLLLQSPKPCKSSEPSVLESTFDKVAHWGCATSLKKRL